MYQKKTIICGREITITAGKDAIYKIICRVEKPLAVTKTTSTESGCLLMTIFGQSWSWDEFPPELKEQYDAELAIYATSLPEIITARSILPDSSWADKYIPNDNRLATMRKNKKLTDQQPAECAVCA